MCRLYGFRSNEETKVECTLVHAQNALMLQSRCDSLGRAHADGWGIGWYDEHGLPVLERHATAAFEGLHFSETAERVYSETVVAHVRLATVGEPDDRNAHPFVNGKWTMAHNGTVTAFQTLEPQMMQETAPWLRRYRVGQTDSELLFYWLLSRIGQQDLAPGEPMDADQLAAIVAQNIAELADRCQRAGAEEPARLNVVLTDGHAMIATRWDNGLFVVHRRDVRDCEICGIPHVHHRPDFAYRATVIASEPISHENWMEVPNHSVIAVDDLIEPTIRRISPTGQLAESVPLVAS